MRRFSRKIKRCPNITDVEWRHAPAEALLRREKPDRIHAKIRHVCATGEALKQGAEAGSTAAAAKALQIEIERGLVVPMRSSTYRFWSGAAELLGEVAEIVPIGFATVDAAKGLFAVAKSRFAGGCTPGF